MRSNLGLKISIIVFVLFLLKLTGCAKAAKSTGIPVAECGPAVSAAGSYFRECTMFNRTCIIGEWGIGGSSNPGTVWCSQ